MSPSPLPDLPSRNLPLITITLLVLAGAAAGCGGSGGDAYPTRTRTVTPTQTVTFLNEQGEALRTVDVAIADDDDSRSLGLMFVYELGPDEGMLFLFEDQTPRSFWMANTPLPLDILYIDETMEIVKIHRNTPPFSQKSFPSERPAMYVVEVNGGFTQLHDIQEGMRIRIGDPG